MVNLNVNKVIKEDAVLKAMVTDLSGSFMEIIFPISALKELISTGIAYDGSSFQGINNINDSDAILLGIEETLVKCHPTIADTEKTEYWIICNILDAHTKKPHPNCARSKLVELQSKLAKLWDKGNLYTGAEPEAFFIENRETVGKDMGGNTNYFNPKDPKAFIITEIQSMLAEMNYKIERAHTEVGENQFEINWEFDRAERTADRIQMFKLVCHKAARNYGFDVTFLPKPYPKINGSGMHMHLSVGDGKINLFYDGKAKSNKYFSENALHFLSGVLENSRAISAIANSTEVSYARLVPGFEAPCIIAIGEYNRSAACRIPAVADEKILKKAIRAEFRFPDPLANPYLLSAGFIATGINGIKNKTKFKGFTDENLYEFTIADVVKKGFKLLPRNLWEAYNEFVNSKVLKEELGESIHTAYSDLILEEIDLCQPYANNKSIQMHYFA